MSNYSFWNRNPHVIGSFIDGSTYIFYAKNICHLYSLFAPIKTIVNSFQNLTLPHDLKEDYPNGNLILREDYQKSFKKEVRWRDIKSFLKTESIGEVYRSYSNGEKIGMCVVHPGKIEFTMVLIGANKL